jgi:hypothetical protein
MARRGKSRLSRFTARQLHEAEYLRAEAADCLRTPEPRLPDVLADVLGRQKVINPANWRARRRPHNDALAGLPVAAMHAVPTRRPGASRELCHGRIGRVSAMWALKQPHVTSLIARYSDSPLRRDAAARRLAALVAGGYHTRKTRGRGGIVAYALLTGTKMPGVRKLLGMSQQEWRSTNARRMAYEIRDVLEELDVESLLAWRRAWTPRRKKVAERPKMR